METRAVDFIYKMEVLLDGDASRNVYYNPEIPEGAIEREVELAHGTKIGNVKGGDIIFVDESVSKEQAERPSLIRLGRLINRGRRLEWTKMEFA